MGQLSRGVVEAAHEAYVQLDLLDFLCKKENTIG